MWLIIGILTGIAAIILLIIGFKRTKGGRKKFLMISGFFFAATIVFILIHIIVTLLTGINLELDNNIPEEVKLSQYSIDVTGEVDYAGTLIVNGEEVSIDDNGKFETVIPLAEGENTIVFTISNYLKDKEYTYTVKRKNPDIPLSLEYDKDIQVLTYTIKGTTETDAKVTLSQEESKLNETIADKDGKFSFTVDTTDEGIYQYSIGSSKENFTDITKAVTINRTLTDIPLELTYDKEITVPSYQLKGTTVKAATVTVRDKNGKTIDEGKANKDGNFSFKLDTFDEGTYTYTVSSSLRGYNTSEQEINIKRTIVDVKLDLDYESNIQAATTTIKGNTQNGATVIINKGDSKIGEAKAG